jgi:hypothetical protein
MTRIDLKVKGVAPEHRNMFGGSVQRQAERRGLDARIDWSGGDSGTKSVVVTAPGDLVQDVQQVVLDGIRGTFFEPCTTVQPA